MMKKAAVLFTGFLGVLQVVAAPQADISGKIFKNVGKPKLAVADIRGSGAAQPLMAVFIQTLYDDLKGSGLLEMVAKGVFPLNNPQQSSDFKGVSAPPDQPTNAAGFYLSDWSGPPPQANYLAFGYTAVQNKYLVLYGWLYNVNQQTLQGAQVFGSRYTDDLSDAGARKIAHAFANDILAKFGGMSLAGTHIFFVSNRTGHKEVWSMEWDGSNQKQITRYRSISIEPAVSPDGSRVAFTSYAKINPAIFMFSVETGRPLPFYNQVASLNAGVSFMPDGKHVVYSSTAAGGDAQIYMANMDGSDFRRISYRRAIEVEPKVNPKTGTEILFVSGPGPQQIYKMDVNGAGVEMVSPGGGEASNPAWHPDGQIMAFSWTRGYATGGFNIFIMDIASRHYDQLTHDEGRNENPSWAPDGRHLVFQSNRRGGYQIWSMLVDGTEVKQLTTQGNNFSPVWGK